MTITYPNRTALEALLLSRGKDTLRAAISGEDDIHIFTHIHNTWVSEECEPVQIDFVWSRSGGADVPTEADCICSKALASRLIAMLSAGTSTDDRFCTNSEQALDLHS